MKICARINCRNVAVWLPKLELRVDVDHSAATAVLLECATCNDHKSQMMIDDFITDAGWKTIITTFTGQGFAKPVRGLTTLVWEPLEVTA